MAGARRERETGVASLSPDQPDDRFPRWVHVGAALCFVLVAVILWWDGLYPPPALNITVPGFRQMEDVIVVKDEGIIYCPISKVGSAEWKRALRWMVGFGDWNGTKFLHYVGKNGLAELSDWGLEGTSWALQSDRFFRFVVVRDPAERLVSAFLNKCVSEGYMREMVTVDGAPRCPYLEYMPELFPNATEGTLETHRQFKDLVESNPENTLYHFATGMRTWIEANDGDACLINPHYRPQVCFCDLREVLSAFHVMRFSNMSAEAAAFASRLPRPADDSTYTETGISGHPGMYEKGRRTGVNEPRREEIRAFLTERFAAPQDTPIKVTHAAQRKAIFLSRRMLAIVRELYKSDYELLGQYFLSEDVKRYNT
ncbi:unnamed protein product [Scytosiphon promiscuus]